MEKQGMGRRKRSIRAGLLVFALLIFSSGISFSEELGYFSAGTPAIRNEIEIETESSSENPVMNNRWSFAIMVNYPNSSAVNVKPPEIPSQLFLERINVESRLVQRESISRENARQESVREYQTWEYGPRENDLFGYYPRYAPEEYYQEPPPPERWTRVEFVFMPVRAGRIVLEPFVVTVPGRQAQSREFSFTIRGEAPVQNYIPSFRWIRPFPDVYPGLRFNASLELVNWNPQFMPPQNFFQGKVPVNAILEESRPISVGSGIYRYNISIIALGEDPVTLGAFSFSHQGIYNLSVPSAAFPVLPAPFTGGTESDAVSEEEFSAENPALIPFPEVSGRAFLPLRETQSRITAKSRDLWEEGRRAEALALIRQKERDSFAGPSLAPLRRQMEQVLGLDYTEDESWRPLKARPVLRWGIMFLIILAASLVVLFPGRIGRQKKVTSGFLNGFRITGLILFFCGAAFILGEGFLGKLASGNFSRPGNGVIVERTQAHRIPDAASAVNAWFEEGQSVISDGSAGEWHYAESSDGKAGWIRREAVIKY